MNIQFVLVFAFSIVILATYSTSSKSAESSNSRSPWSIRCDKDKAGNTTHCEMYHRLVVKDTKKRVAEFAIGYSKGDASPRIVTGVIILPLGIKVQEGVVVSIDGKEGFRAKVDSCLESGCYVFVKLSEQVLSKLKRGNEASLLFKVTNKKYMKVKMSLSGFTKTLQKIS